MIADRRLRLVSLILVLALPAAAATPWLSGELRDRQSGPVQGLAFTFDGRFLASADDDGTLIVRLFPGPKVYATLKGSRLTQVAWSPDGRTLVAGSLDDVVYVWRQPFMDAPRMLPCSGPVYAVAVSPDGVILAAGGGDHTIQRWRMPVMMELPPFRGHTDDVYTVCASPDGGTVVSAGKDRTIAIWDASGRQARIIHGRDNTVYDVIFNPSGTLLGSVYGDGTVALWSTQTWRLDRLMPGPSRPIQRLAMSRNSRWLAGAGIDKTVWVWALGDTATALGMPGHRGKVNAVAFAPNGPWLASAGSDTTVRLWAVP